MGMDDWLTLVGMVVMALHGIAVFIVNATDDPTHRKYLKKVYRVIKVFAGIIYDDKVKSWVEKVKDNYEDMKESK